MATDSQSHSGLGYSGFTGSQAQIHTSTCSLTGSDPHAHRLTDSHLGCSQLGQFRFAGVSVRDPQAYRLMPLSQTHSRLTRL